MTTGEHALTALQALCRARQALDDMWLDTRQTAPSAEQLDALVFGVVVELVAVHDALERVVESSVRAMISSVDRLTPNGGRKDA